MTLGRCASDQRAIAVLTGAGGWATIAVRDVVNRPDNLEARLERELAGGHMTQAQVDDVREQRARFDSNREAIERDHSGRAAGFVAGQMVVAESVEELVDRAKREFPGRMLYAEPIGFDLLGGAGL
jgi:hypothetical protein